VSTNWVVGEAYAADAVVAREYDRLLVAVFSHRRRFIDDLGSAKRPGGDPGRDE